LLRLKSLRRTMLFVPGNNPRMIEKASTTGADMVLLDSEDAVPQPEKGRARQILREGFAAFRWGSKEVGVRVNGMDTPYYGDDLRNAVQTGVHFITLPKIEKAGEVREAERDIKKAAGRGAKEDAIPKILVTIENPQGLNVVEEILSASPLVTAVEFGAEDYALSMGIHGIARSVSSTLYARSRVVAAAHALSVDPLDQSFVGLNDPEGLRASALDAKGLGFVGKAVIHPNQIDIVNQVFSPSKDDVTWARRLLEAWKAAQAEGRGAFRLDDKMVDAVHVKMAEEILKKAKALGPV
jgi:citrate lyase subunit beta / citryl-CoA lyase